MVLCRDYQFSTRRACGLIGFSRSSNEYRGRPDRHARIREQLVTLSGKHRRYGYRMLHAKLGQEGFKVNVKVVERLYREERLTLRRRNRKKIPKGVREGAWCPIAANQRWSLDFTMDALANGRKFRTVNLKDDCTRHINKIRIAKHASIETFKADLARIDREHEKLVDAICDGVPETKVKDRMISLEAQQRELEDKLVNCKDDPVLFHPNMSAVYRQQVSHLAKALNDLNGCTEAAEILRSLIDRITITSDSRTGLLAVDLEGGLAGNLSLSQTNKKMSPPLLKTTFRN